MKDVFKKINSAAVSLAMALGMMTVMPAGADDAVTKAVSSITVHFDMSEEGVTVMPDENDDPVEVTDITTDVNSSVRLPKATLLKDGYYFSGWTADGVRGYVSNSVMQVKEEDVTLYPVWTMAKDPDVYNVEFKVEINGELQELPKSLKGMKGVKGQFIKIPLDTFDYPDKVYAQLGWVYDGQAYSGQQYIIMPDHDIELTPNWLKYYKYTVCAGDVDRLNGAMENTFERYETSTFETPEAKRFSRNGFQITGWLSDYDDQVYGVLSKFTMPSADVTLTAIWEPIKYVIVFRPGTSSSDNIKIPGETDMTITCPDINVTKNGYYFAGWEYEGKVYQPGDDFLILGAKPGMGIALNAVWKEGTAPDPSGEDEIFYGDANCDETISIGDAVLIMQALANPDKYGLDGYDETALTEQGAKNADCYIPGTGVTAMDALAVQKNLLGAYTELPVKTADE